MSRLLFLSATLAFVYNPIGTWAQLPNGQCSAEDLVCEVQDNNLVGIISVVANLAECLETQNEAGYVTYFGPSGFPFVSSCLFFSACDTLGEKFRSYLSLYINTVACLFFQPQTPVRIASPRTSHHTAILTAQLRLKGHLDQTLSV